MFFEWRQALTIVKPDTQLRKYAVTSTRPQTAAWY
jgi:hypothetical protein